MIHGVTTSGKRVTTNDNERQRMITSRTTSGKQWYKKRQWLTTNENELQLIATSDKKWQKVTMSDNEWQRVVILANFPFFWIREEPTSMHPKETI